jgi:hypothetical protein
LPPHLPVIQEHDKLPARLMLQSRNRRRDLLSSLRALGPASGGALLRRGQSKPLRGLIRLGAP